VPSERPTSTSLRAIVPLLALATAACATTGRLAGQPTAQDEAAARARTAALEPALQALTAGDLPRAEALLLEAPSAEGLALRGVVRWLIAQRDLASDARTALLGGALGGTINERYVFTALDHAEEALAAVEGDLAAAEEEGFVYLSACPACWRIDADGDGEVDGADAELLEVEVDATGEPLPEGDARRRPTFRFDRGDVAWARAMVAYQRALLAGLRAYHWGDVSGALRPSSEVLRVVIRLVDAGPVHRARDLVGDGLRHARRARLEYLAETDDDHEWVPSPVQRSHAVPLPVDEALYTTWLEVLDDTQRLVDGEEGLDLSAMAGLVDPELATRIHGYLDLHEALERPGDLTLDLQVLQDARAEPQAALRSLLGGTWRAEMKPSRLGTVARRLQAEVDAGLEPWTRKLRYLLWLN
jgi:hypothetical protein